MINIKQKIYYAGVEYHFCRGQCWWYYKGQVTYVKIQEFKPCFLAQLHPTNLSIAAKIKLYLHYENRPVTISELYRVFPKYNRRTIDNKVSELKMAGYIKKESSYKYI